LFLMVVILSFLYFLPFGEISYEHDFSESRYNLLGGQGFFHNLGPKERVKEKNKIMGDPAYFYLRAFRNFNSADLKIKYSFSDDLLKNDYLDFKIGVLVDKDNWRYKMYPVYNKTLNDLSETWDLRENDGLLFLQKEKVFDDYLSFLDQADFSRTAFYNYNINHNYIIPDYEKSNEDEKLIIEGLRGSYSFFTYIKDENLKIDFSFYSLKPEKEKPYIYVYQQDNLIFNDEIDTEEELELNIADLSEGFYRVEIQASEDLISEKIETPLSKLAFLNRMWLFDQKEGFNLFSNQNDFRIKAFNSACLDDVVINEEKFSLDRIYQQVNLNIDGNDLNKISSESCGLLIENNGVFAFSRDSFFDPRLASLNDDTRLNNLDFILADYHPSKKKKEFYTSEIEIDLSEAFKEDGSYQFIISAPSLKYLEPDKYIEIHSIEMCLKTNSLLDKIRNIR
jgi:hypothetical protein